MGKSGKKIKSDRINTLRKQYDAFLDDDRKRKDRNKFILKRLEEMQSSSALVQIRHKDNDHLNENIHTNRRVSNLRLENNLSIFRNSAKIPINYSSQRFDPSVLREISKSFILIPKLSSNISNSVANLNPLIEISDMIKNEDTDWKSKYDILNELKKSEKESNSVNENVSFEEPNKPYVSSSEPLIKQESQIFEDKTPADKLQNYNTATHDPQSANGISNSIENVITSRSQDTHDERNYIDNKIETKICTKPSILFTEPNKNNQYTTYIDNSHEMESPRQQFPEHKPEIITNIEGTPQDFINAEYTNKVDNESKYKEKSDQEKFKNENMQHNTSNEQDVRDKNVLHTENTDCSNLPSNEDILTTEKIQEGLKGDIEIDSNVKELQICETNEAPVINEQIANAEISELENEQNEMFYTENPENNYSYNENNIENLQYAEENQNYTNEQYYNETQQQQPYAAEINEHEESTERYDPNYEQQYTENYENVTDVPQYENQQYDVDNSYEIQQDPVKSNVSYDELQPNNENTEHVPSEDLYQNQEETVYNYGNENYESQQYATNEQQEYLTTDSNIQDQYAVEQEYVGMDTEQETPVHVEKVFDLENEYVDNENTIIANTKEIPVVPDVLFDKTESSEVS